MNAQEKIVYHLTSLPISRSKLVKDLSRILSLTERTIYDRLSGKTQFTVTEIEIILHNFEMDVNSIFESNVINKFYNYDITEFIDENIQTWLRELNNLNEADSVSLFVSSNNLPFSLVFGYPDLMKFQIYFMFYFLHPDYDQVLIPFDLNDPIFYPLEEICISIDSLYRMIPVTEIWGDGVIKMFIRQLRYAYLHGKISERDFKKIILVVHEIVDLTMNYVIYGAKQTKRSLSLKPEGASFTLIYNYLMPIEEYTILQYDDLGKNKSRVYNPVFGSIVTESQKKAAENYFYHVQKMGTNLTTQSPQDIRTFFKNIHQDVDRLNSSDSDIK